ncbi:hypothetical protein GCM10010954_31720 [Halobacillus andaensis]|uniref:DUF624 domain-containing protein n=1 Tax=Halobacillus andaensis TaxID=1176239 RepID=A0A917B7N3_HALAA|nr:DUF624 domain-containing protein [Halobacillus andaensis]MBP2005278.1 putative membrane protein YesL [Halobacillus andaensis]GGF30249.1 hypothetical protein GCM10010954_31720 [Halobacillus andaensis]
MTGTGGWIYIVCDWLMRLAIVNLIWIVLCLAGGVMLGIYPASVVCAGLLIQWMAGERPASLFSYSFKEFKRCFWRANRIFLISMALLTILGVNTLISLQFEGIWFYLFVSSTFMLALGIIITLSLALLPLSAGRKGIGSVKEAIHFMLMHPGRVLGLITGGVIAAITIRLIPGLLPLYSVNLLLLVTVFMFQGPYFKRITTTI